MATLLLLITFFGVLLTCCPPLTAASRLSKAYERALLEVDSNKPPQVIRAELIHRDHPDSPLSFARGTNPYAAATSQKARIARSLRTGVEFTTPLSFEDVPDATDAEYVMTLYLGTPPQKFVVIVDTGSDLVWVQCKPCTHPYHCYKPTVDPVFDPSASSSYSAVPCKDISICNTVKFGEPTGCNAKKKCLITYAYGTPGSQIEGVLSTETIAFSNTTEGQLEISNFLFGCMDNNTASFGTVDGLAGFGQGFGSLPSQLSKLTSVNVFSYCLVPFIASTKLTSPLSFGASNPKGVKLVHTPILDNPTPIPVLGLFYWVNMTGISIDGFPVSIPEATFQYNSATGSGGTIFDSGTSLMFLSQDIYIPVVQILQASITYPVVPDPTGNNLICYNISGVQQPEHPSMTLHFSKTNGRTEDFLLTGENLFFLAGDDVECLALYNQGIESPNIIGNVAQANHYVEYNLARKRLGWTSNVDCTAFPM